MKSMDELMDLGFTEEMAREYRQRAGKAKPKKRTLAAVSPRTGKTFTRTTHREYSHVVVVKFADEDFERAWAWSGRRDLAEKVASRWNSPKRKSPEYVEIVPVQG